jgi:hypothetical protein
VKGSIARRACLTCSKDPNILRKKDPVPKKSRLRRCQGCCQMTRPYKTGKKEFPNTVARGTSRLCVTCYEKERRGLPWWEMQARSIDVPPLSLEERIAAAKVVVRFGGGTIVLEALGLKDVYAEVR